MKKSVLFVFMMGTLISLVPKAYAVVVDEVVDEVMVCYHDSASTGPYLLVHLTSGWYYYGPQINTNSTYEKTVIAIILAAMTAGKKLIINANPGPGPMCHPGTGQTVTVVGSFGPGVRMH